jgi:hypothetical protein
MLSGLASLEWKWVKNAGQWLKLLFTGAQKTANLACYLWTVGQEKPYTAFVEVVEGWLIYNFPIYRLDHFSSKILRKS